MNETIFFIINSNYIIGLLTQKHILKKIIPIKLTSFILNIIEPYIIKYFKNNDNDVLNKILNKKKYISNSSYYVLNKILNGKFKLPNINYHMYFTNFAYGFYRLSYKKNLFIKWYKNLPLSKEDIRIIINNNNDILGYSVR